MLRARLDEALKSSLLARDARATSTVRLILAALKDRDIAERGKGNVDGLTDDQILQLLQTMVKQREESIRLYQQGGRQDLADEERAEIAIIREFLPPQLTPEEVEAAVADIIEELSATSLKDMGRVMAALKDRFAGSMDFTQASGIVRTRLAAEA
ncbi:MAG: GatB/YqeY domain-containing protein [Rhodospirillales bacterium]|nr:GatB/YqeY domain-containing protein [Rhodospirillales bacterium]